MGLLLPSFLAGLLTILAPCILSLLPVILGGSVGQRNVWRPLVITISVAVSVILFTILLKGTSVFINVPTSFWQTVSGGLIVFIGFTMVFPEVWYFVCTKLHLDRAETLIGNQTGKTSMKDAILLGAALGPVFTTCSPTYGIIIATVLPVSFAQGIIYLVVYCLGLMIPLLAIGYGGRAIVSKIRFAANPNGIVKRTVGLILVITGILIVTGLDKKIESAILDSGYFGPIAIEESILSESGQK